MAFIKKLKRSNYITNILHLIFRLASRLPVKKNFIMFESYSGKHYSCNPRAIYEYIEANNLNYTMLWSAHKENIEYFQKNGIPHVRRLSIRWIFHMARAQYWVSNSRLPLWLPKPDHTTYLQTWHGTPLKKLGIDIEEVHMPATTTEKYKANFVKSSRKWDYLISPNEYSTNIFKRAFDFNKEMIESGYPRNDYLVLNNNDQFVDDLKLKLKIPLDKKVILYAPTWRDNNYYSVGKYKFALQLDLDEMKRSLSDDYVVILRMHYLVAESFDLSSYENFVYDFSSYEDIRDLYLLADLLVTDYSSVFFDYAILKRPILFFAYDIDDYRENLRGFYFNFEETIPGPIVKTTSDLITAINEISDRHFMVGEDFEKFFAKFCALEDGKATKRVIESVFYNKNN